MLTEGILDTGYYTEATDTHTLTIAGIRDVPVEITGGLRIYRHDLRSTHEEGEEWCIISETPFHSTNYWNCCTYFFWRLI